MNTNGLQLLPREREAIAAQGWGEIYLMEGDKICCKFGT